MIYNFLIIFHHNKLFNPYFFIRCTFFIRNLSYASEAFIANNFHFHRISFAWLVKFAIYKLKESVNER
jgi:hypothetical protein